MPGFRGLSLTDADGEHWGLALELLESGDAEVRIGSVRFYHLTHGPHPDSRIQISIQAGAAPASLTLMGAEKDVADALSLIATLKTRDQRFDQLLQRFGSFCQLIDDYGMGTVALADVDPAGQLNWRDGFLPKT